MSNSDGVVGLGAAYRNRRERVLGLGRAFDQSGNDGAPAISPTAIAYWQKRMGYNDTEAMQALGISSRHTWTKYRAEGAGLTIALACNAVAKGIGVYSLPPPIGDGAVLVFHHTRNSDGEIISPPEPIASVGDFVEANELIESAQREYRLWGCNKETGWLWAHNAVDFPLTIHYWRAQRPSTE